MTYSKEIGGDRIKPSSIGATDVDLAGVATLANAQEFTDPKTFSAGVEVRDSTLAITSTGSPQPPVSIDTNGIYSVSNGAVAPIQMFTYDPFFPGLMFVNQVRFQQAERHENVAHYNPTATIIFDDQTNVNHAANLPMALPW